VEFNWEIWFKASFVSHSLAGDRSESLFRALTDVSAKVALPGNCIGRNAPLDCDF
jgi:hypothetical protein